MIGTDLLYDVEFHKPLLKTLTTLARGGDGAPPRFIIVQSDRATNALPTFFQHSRAAGWEWKQTRAASGGGGPRAQGAGGLQVRCHCLLLKGCCN